MIEMTPVETRFDAAGHDVITVATPSCCCCCCCCIGTAAAVTSLVVSDVTLARKRHGGSWVAYLLALSVPIVTLLAFAVPTVLATGLRTNGILGIVPLFVSFVSVLGILGAAHQVAGSRDPLASATIPTVFITVVAPVLTVGEVLLWLGVIFASDFDGTTVIAAAVVLVILGIAIGGLVARWNAGVHRRLDERTAHRLAVTAHRPAP